MAYDLSVAKARNPLIVITIFAAIGVATTILRLKSRKMRNINLGIDDYFMLAALFFLLVSIGIQFACVIAGGVGRHIEDVNPLDVVKTLKLILPFEALYGVTLCFIKTSIICSYLRIFGATRSFRISAYVAILILIMWALIVILETFLLCRPLAYNWDSMIKGTCGDRNTVYVSAGALNVVTDFMVMSLPIPHILKLQLPLKRKLGLLLMFSLGLFITIISIIRIKSLQVISFTDPTFTLPMGLLWTTLEPCLCIINANLPMVRTYLIGVAPRIFGSTADQTSHKPTGPENGSRPDPFELILDDRYGYGANDINLDQTKMENTIMGGGKGRRGEDSGSESERYLTKGSAQIVVARSVDVESL